MSQQKRPRDLRDDWFRVALAVCGVLTRSKIFAPASDVRLGSAAFNDFVITDAPWESLLVISSGTTLHLLPESDVRMAGDGLPLTVARYDRTGPTVVATAERVKHCVSYGLTMFVHYHPRRQHLEEIVRGLHHMQGLVDRFAPRVVQTLPVTTAADTERVQNATFLLVDLLAAVAALSRSRDNSDAVEAQRELLRKSALNESTDEAIARLLSDHARLAEMLSSERDPPEIRRHCTEMLAAFGVEADDLLAVDRADSPPE